MTRLPSSVTTLQTKEITERLCLALAVLRNSGECITVERARAIAACAAEIVESAKVEARLSGTIREKQ